MPGRTQHLVLLFMVVAIFSCTTQPEVPRVQPSATGYDAKLAEELGADEYGMRSYVLVVLKTGPANIPDGARRDEIFKGHFSNMASLAEKKLLVLAGPFMGGGDKRGLYIFNVETVEEAQKLVLTDPAVAAGIFDAEFTRYYGSAALMAINELHERVQRTKVE